MYGLKIIMSPIVIANSEDKVLNIVHEACLKYIFEKLVVYYSSTSFDFKNDCAICAEAVGIERLVNVVIQPKEDRNGNL